jgi:hypothetical protein
MAGLGLNGTAVLAVVVEGVEDQSDFRLALAHQHLLDGTIDVASFDSRNDVVAVFGISSFHLGFTFAQPCLRVGFGTDQEGFVVLVFAWSRWIHSGGVFRCGSER